MRDFRKIIDIKRNFRIGLSEQNYYVTQDVTVRNCTGADLRSRDLNVHASIDKDNDLEDVTMSWLARMIQDRGSRTALREILGNQWGHVGRLWLNHLEAISLYESSMRKYKELSIQLQDEITSLKELGSKKLGLDPIVPPPQGQGYQIWKGYEDSVENWKKSSKSRISDIEGQLQRMTNPLRPKRPKSLKDDILLGRRIGGWHYSIKDGTTNLAVCFVSFVEPNYAPDAWKWSFAAETSTNLRSRLPPVNNRQGILAAVNTNVKAQLRRILCATGCSILDAPAITLR